MALCTPQSEGACPEQALRREGFTCVVPRLNDYTRMFSAPARRPAKKPRPDDDVELRDRAPDADRADRLSASDFYSVTDDVTPQPFKGDAYLATRLTLFRRSDGETVITWMV